MVFGRKRGRPPANLPDLPEEETEISEAKTEYDGEGKPSEPPKKVEIPEHIKVVIQELMRYRGVYSPADFANPEIEVLNLLFAMHAEILNLRADIKELTETIKSVS